MIPKYLQHNFVFDLELTFSSAEEKRVYRCAYCGTWSENVTIFNESREVCPKRDRRYTSRRKREDRRGHTEVLKEWS